MNFQNYFTFIITTICYNRNSGGGLIMHRKTAFNRTLLIIVLIAFAASTLIGYGSSIGSSKADDKESAVDQIYVTPDKDAVKSNPTVPYYQKYSSELDEYEGRPWALSELQTVGLMYDISYILPDMPDAILKSLIDKLANLIERSGSFTSGESIDPTTGQKQILSVLTRWEKKDFSQMYNDRSFLLNSILGLMLQEYGIEGVKDKRAGDEIASKAAQDCSSIINAINAFLGINGNMDYEEFKNLIQLKKKTADVSAGYSLELNEISEILSNYEKSGLDKKYKNSITSPLLEIEQRLQFIIDYPPGFYKQ